MHRTSTVAAHETAILSVIDGLRQDPCSAWPLSRMARLAEMSPFYFSRVFTESTGVGPEHFVAALRIDRAKALLLTTTASVTSICFDVGYNSLGTFTRLFTEAVGITPTGFRKLREDLTKHSPEGAIKSYVMQTRARENCYPLRGSLSGPPGFRGVVFVGLFASRIPKRRPLSGVTLIGGGRFVLERHSASTTGCLLAAGFPTPLDEEALLLPTQRSLLLASRWASRCTPRATIAGAINEEQHLQLRLPHPFDPPILIALPVLLSTTPWTT